MSGMNRLRLTRVNSIKLKTPATLPTQLVSGGTGIDVTRENGQYVVAVNDDYIATVTDAAQVAANQAATSASNAATSATNASNSAASAAASASDAADSAAAAASSAVVGKVATRTALKALVTATYNTAVLSEFGREGVFLFKSGDYSSQITADTQEGIYIKADDTAASSGAWVRVYSGWANVKWFGAKGDNSAADLTSLQAATDLVSAVFVPDGTYKTNNAWLVDDYCEIHFESRQAIILSTSTSAIIRARGHTSTRNYHIQIYGGQLNGGGTSGPVGLQFRSASMVKVYGTFITACSAAVENGGSGAQGAFYNDYFGVDITTCSVGYRNGTLGNEIHVYGGRIGDVVVGTDDDDNSGVLYEGVAIETFTNSGHRLANAGSACIDVRSIGCRLENPSGNPSYASAVGVRVNAAAQDTSIISPGFTTVATNIADSGTRTQVLFAEDYNQFAGGTRFKTKKRIVVNQAISSLASNATRQDSFAVTGVADGDTVSVTLPSAWPASLVASPPIVGAGQVFIQLYNPTLSPISMSADDFAFEWTDYT